MLEAFVYYIDIYDNSERPDAAETGKLRGDKLKSVGEGVYARESETGASYYFMVDIDE